MTCHHDFNEAASLADLKSISGDFLSAVDYITDAPILANDRAKFRQVINDHSAALARLVAADLERNGPREGARNPKFEAILWEVVRELGKATRKFPRWPTDPIHALAVLGEEFGELTKEIVQFTYEPQKSSPDAIIMEARHTAAMAIRLMLSISEYKNIPAPQHSQSPIEMEVK